MNQKKAYEEIIKGKLEALPLPDMADTIWNRIETRLDIDMPAQQGGNGPGSSAGGWAGLSGLLILAAFTAALTLSTNRQKTSSPQKAKHSAPTRITTVPATAYGNENRPAFKADPSTFSQKNSNSLKPANLPTTDSIAAPSSLVINLKNDSVQQTVPDQVFPLPIVDSTLQKKKSKGLTGISDVDYRIIPDKKDTAKKKQ